MIMLAPVNKATSHASLISRGVARLCLHCERVQRQRLEATRRLSTRAAAAAAQPDVHATRRQTLLASAAAAAVLAHPARAEDKGMPGLSGHFASNLLANSVECL